MVFPSQSEPYSKRSYLESHLEVNAMYPPVNWGLPQKSLVYALTFKVGYVKYYWLEEIFYNCLYYTLAYTYMLNTIST